MSNDRGNFDHRTNEEMKNVQSWFDGVGGNVVIVVMILILIGLFFKLIFG